MPEKTELRALANKFPHQGGVAIGAWLERFAAGVVPGSAIIELGCWLGGGTAHLALGAMESGAPIFTWDRFICVNEEERGKAAAFKIDFKIGTNTLPWVQDRLKPFPAQIMFNKGSFRKFVWDDKISIGLYVDDLTKVDEIWRGAMDAFLPSFIPAKTHLFLMDYHFDEAAGPKYAAQKRWMAQNQNRFELIQDRMAGTSTALFKFLQ